MVANQGASILGKGSDIETLALSFYQLPIGYSGRSASIFVSGTPFQRPQGQYPTDGKAVSGTCQKLDFGVEFAAFIGKGNDMGDAIDVSQGEDHIFGVVLMNDWSARDIQFWESSLMWPLNSKNFCRTVSPWIVPLEALEPFPVASQKAVGLNLVMSNWVIFNCCLGPRTCTGTSLRQKKSQHTIFLFE